MDITKLADSVIQFFAKTMKQRCRILSILPGENEWISACEVDVDSDYTTKRGMGDIVEIYEIHINGNMEVVSFTLKETKRKAALDKE